MRKIVAGLAVALAADPRRDRTRPPDVDPRPTEALRARYARKAAPSVDHCEVRAAQAAVRRPAAGDRGLHLLPHGAAPGGDALLALELGAREYIEGRGIRYIGKKNILNNFCIGVAGSRESCDKCHIGYGWGDRAVRLHERPQRRLPGLPRQQRHLREGRAAGRATRTPTWTSPRSPSTWAARSAPTAAPATSSAAAATT